MIHHINNPNEDIPSLILLRNSSEMVLNLGLIEHGELRVIFGYNAHLDLAGLEVCRQYSRETVDCQLDGLVV